MRLAGPGLYHRAGINIDARSTKANAAITVNSFRAGAECAFDNNMGSTCGTSGPVDTAIYVDELQSGITNVVIPANDLLDSSSTDAIIANGSGTTVKFTGSLTDLPNSARGVQ
jgi:hypothetical protein